MVGLVYRIWRVKDNATLLEVAIELAVKGESPPPNEPREAKYEAAFGPDGTSLIMPPPPGLPAVPAVQYDVTCLQIPENMTYEKWAELGGTLQMMGKGLPWWAGRWVNFGEAKYGEKYSQAIEETGLSRGLLANYAWVESKVEPSVRNENLSWSHHRMVADLEPKEQREWLQKAQDEHIPANALRAMIKGEEPDTCPVNLNGRHEFTCKHCGKGR
jgi:hypothetical protein